LSLDVPMQLRGVDTNLIVALFTRFSNTRT
jgi:hypothetical protein